MKKFKTKILLALSILAMLIINPVISNAQDESQSDETNSKNGEVGLRFMPTFSKFDVNTSDGNTISGEAKLGFGASFHLGFNFNDHIGIQGELIYSSLGQTYTENDIENKITIQYVNIPLLVSLNTNKSKQVNLNLVAGPQIGFNVGSSLSSPNDGSDTLNTSAVLSVKGTDIGFAWGAGVDFALNTERTLRLGLGYRGVFGLLEIGDSNKTLETNQYYVIDKSKLNTDAIYLGVHWMF